MSQGQHNAAKTHCPKGHEYTEENTSYRKKGNGFSRWCRACARANGEVQRIKVYGITVERYREMLAEQDGRCAICRIEFASPGEACVDHDHACCPDQKSCGECVRGLLCHRCNRGLGQFMDSTVLLAKAAEYLSRSESQLNA